MIKAYLRLAKPGVMLGNLLTTVAGFLLAANGNIDFILFLATTAGTGLVISSACVINNVLDQDIDSKMKRTKTRPLITGEANPTLATVFGITIGLLGLVVLSLWTNWWVTGVGIFGFITYVWLYGALGKRKSVHGTLVGSLSGAAPILAGYVAVRPGIDAGGVLLFIILFVWQMPEFYSISIYRRKEYKAAGVPVISVIKGVEHTKREIFAYTLAFIASSLALFGFGYVDYTYLIIMAALNFYWFRLALEGLKQSSQDIWAKSMFQFSIKILLVFCALISLESFLP